MTTSAPPALFADADATLLDLADNILTKGVVIDAEIVLGLAGVDLVYVRLSALVSAADKIRRVLAQRVRCISTPCSAPRPRRPSARAWRVSLSVRSTAVPWSRPSA